jgi:hypothetical protein
MKTWDIQKTQFKVADFINWSKNGELNLSPMFQRRAVWAKGAKSYLVDTILRGLPIPPVILRDLPPDIRTFQSIREVVDGQQRLRTLLTFIAPQLVNDFDPTRDHFTISKSHNESLAGAGFRDLSKKLQQQVLDYQFMVHIFPSETDDRDILEIFARMNATGTKLNNQELRNAEYFGEFKSVAFSMAAENLEIWRSWQLFSEANIARMLEVEFTSELMIFAIMGVTDNNSRVIDASYRQYDDDFPGKSEIIKRLRGTITIIDESYRSRMPELLRSKAIVYAIFATVYDLLFGIGSKLSPKKAGSVSKPKLETIGSRARLILNQKAPKSVLLAFEARSSQAKNRRILVEYLSSGTTP